MLCLLFAAGIGLTGCLAVGTPPAGEALVATAGKAVVFGRATILDRDRSVPPANPGSDWSSVGPAPRPELTLYLLRLSPRRIARPQFAGQGAFYWYLAPGDYLLVGSPAADVGEPGFAQHHWPIAALRVAPTDSVVCAGELAIEAAGSSMALEPTPTIQFGVGAVTVTDSCPALTAKLESRFAALGSPPGKRLLVTAADLEFSDPALFHDVRVLLDAAP